MQSNFNVFVFVCACAWTWMLFQCKRSLNSKLTQSHYSVLSKIVPYLLIADLTTILILAFMQSLLMLLYLFTNFRVILIAIFTFWSNSHHWILLGRTTSVKIEVFEAQWTMSWDTGTFLMLTRRGCNITLGLAGARIANALARAMCPQTVSHLAALACTHGLTQAYNLQLICYNRTHISKMWVCVRARCHIQCVQF